MDLSQLNLVYQKLAELDAVWKPHPKQLSALSVLLFQKKDRMALEWGRRTGKGDVVVALMGLWGQLVPGSQSYAFGPWRKEVERIFWKSGKIEQVLPGNWIDEMNSTELQVYWSGGIRSSKTGKLPGWWILDGAENVHASRGIEPREGILILDEVREMERVVLDVLNPIRARWGSPLVLTSTPPDSLVDEDDPEKPHWVIEEFDDIALDPYGFYSHATSYDNPYLNKDFIDNERTRLERRGEVNIFEREYLAKRVPKTIGRQFAGVMKENQHKRNYNEIVEELSKQDISGSCSWYALTDPGVSLKINKKSVWAWLFLCVHPFTKRVYFLDEIYCKNTAQMTTTEQWKIAEQKIMELYPNLSVWNLHYDEAESWFANEMIDKFDVVFSPSLKQSRSKYEGFALLKDMFLANQLVMSDRCINTWNEFLNYENEKSRDHVLDLSRYFINVAGYTQAEIQLLEPERTRTVKKLRHYRNAMTDEDNWHEKILNA